MTAMTPAPAASRAVRTRFVPTPAVPAATDPRWQVLAQLRAARRTLGLKDRDLAVLRGLMSLLPAADWGGAMVVFGSNRVLSERCDGIEERTLRRRLAHLEEVGLIIRRLSPNGKRYALRDSTGEVLMAYGFDLSPLARLEEQLTALAAAEDARAHQIRLTKTMIRDRLYHLDLDGADAGHALRENARLALRRTLPLEDLEELLTALDDLRAALPAPEIAATEIASPDMLASKMSASDSQIDRHIQKNTQDLYDLNPAPNDGEPAPEAEAVAQSEAADLSLSACLAQTPAVTALTVEQPRSWREMIGLAARLAPAIGLKARQWQEAMQAMGQITAALAVLGLIEAFDRIKLPQAYLARLIGQARDGVLDRAQMFRSLTRAKMPVLKGV